MAKHIIKGKVESKDQRVFTVGTSGASEQKVMVDFGRKVKYRVVKLSIQGLPRTDGKGKKITWINNFGVKGPSGRYAKRVRYTLFLRNRRGKTFVYFDHRGLKQDKKLRPSQSKAHPRGWFRVIFNSGDPAVGYK